MAGTLDHFQKYIKCPHCGKKILVNMVCEDFEEPELVGGQTVCEHCGEIIKDIDLEED